MNASFSIQQEAELFEAARRLENPAAQRVFLEQACPDNPALRERLEKLLAVQSNAEKFFDGSGDFSSLLRSDDEARRANGKIIQSP